MPRKRTQVQSWYDKGLRLKEPEWPAVGGKAGPHRMAGTMPMPAPRELWYPPPGWTPPSKPVQSWYDQGLRLAPPAPVKNEATYAAKKAAYDARRLVLLPPTGANKLKTN